MQRRVAEGWWFYLWQGRWYTATQILEAVVWSSLAPASRFPLNVLLFFLSAESEKKTDSWIVWLYIGLISTGLIVLILFLYYFLWKLRGCKAKFRLMFWSRLWEFRSHGQCMVLGSSQGWCWDILSVFVVCGFFWCVGEELSHLVSMWWPGTLGRCIVKPLCLLIIKSHCKSNLTSLFTPGLWMMWAALVFSHIESTAQRGEFLPPVAHILLIAQWDNLPSRFYWFNQELLTLVRVFPN